MQWTTQAWSPGRTGTTTSKAGRPLVPAPAWSLPVAKDVPPPPPFLPRFHAMPVPIRAWFAQASRLRPLDTRRYHSRIARISASMSPPVWSTGATTIRRSG